MHETILVVDDDEVVCRAAARMLTARGYRVLQATTPQAALDLAADGETIDLLLTDVRMPGISGPELATRFLARHPAAAVMFISGYSRDVLRDDDGHPDAPFLVKPFSPQALGRSVADTLDRQRGLASWQQPGALEGNASRAVRS